MAVETDFAKELENFRKRCLELEEKSKKHEIRCLMLESENEDLRKRNEELEGKIAAVQKVVVDSDYLDEVMIENKVLECEKQKAETEVYFLKEKVKELESNMKGLNEKVKEGVHGVSKGTKDVFRSQVRKRLSFEEDGCSNKMMGPSTPGIGQSPFPGIISISDEDEISNEIPKVKDEYYGSRKCVESRNLQKTYLEHIDEEHVDEFRVHSTNTRSAKRKLATKIVSSDDEDSYDDNAPICTLKTQDTSRVSSDSEEEVKEKTRRRYLTRLRKSESKKDEDKSTIDLNTSFSSSDDEEENEGVDESESEGESLGGFIVDSSESVSNCDPESSDTSDESEDALNDYKVTLDKIGRRKITNLKWDLEGDMLSDFGKDPELCMSAVCALYRKQTADEQASKVTIYHNEQGFSQPDATRGSNLAQFLMDGDPNGDLNKTVEELKEYDSKGIKVCRALATKYSKQLFKIYQNKEDRYFPPKR